jgi:hypothetical protein
MRSALTLGLVLLFGCLATTPEVKKEAVAETPRLLVAMERSPCFGACPVYRVEVFTDGLVRFEGKRFVKALEVVEAKLSPAQVKAISDRFAAIDFKWADYTHADATDNPTVVLTHETRTLKHYHGDHSAPEGLTKLEDDLDALIGTAKWIKGEAVDR